MAFCLKIEAAPEVGINLFCKQSQSSQSHVMGNCQKNGSEGPEATSTVYDETTNLWMAEPVSWVYTVYLLSLYTLQPN